MYYSGVLGKPVIPGLEVDIIDIHFHYALAFIVNRSK